MTNRLCTLCFLLQTRMQSLSPVSAGQTIVSTYRNMVLKEGWLRYVFAAILNSECAYSLQYSADPSAAWAPSLPALDRHTPSTLPPTSTARRCRRNCFRSTNR